MNKRIRSKFRQVHRKISPILFLPILLSALSGIAYRLGRTWFGLSDDFGELMLTLHEGKFLGEDLVPIYILLVGLGLIGMVITGVTMMLPLRQQNWTKSKKIDNRGFHRYLAALFFLPLLISASTGIIFRLGKTWFGLSADHAKLVLAIHQGTYLGSYWRVFYILLIGLGLLGLLVTGIQMTGLVRKPIH